MYVKHAHPEYHAGPPVCIAQFCDCPILGYLPRGIFARVVGVSETTTCDNAYHRDRPKKQYIRNIDRSGPINRDHWCPCRFRVPWMGAVRPAVDSPVEVSNFSSVCEQSFLHTKNAEEDMEQKLQYCRMCWKAHASHGSTQWASQHLIQFDKIAWQLWHGSITNAKTLWQMLADGGSHVRFFLVRLWIAITRSKSHYSGIISVDR